MKPLHEIANEYWAGPGKDLQSDAAPFDAAQIKARAFGEGIEISIEEALALVHEHNAGVVVAAEETRQEQINKGQLEFWR